jgi:hypothetical protein
MTLRTIYAWAGEWFFALSDERDNLMRSSTSLERLMDDHDSRQAFRRHANRRVEINRISTGQYTESLLWCHLLVPFRMPDFESGASSAKNIFTGICRHVLIRRQLAVPHGNPIGSFYRQGSLGHPDSALLS